MATESPADDFVKSLEISPSIEDLYNKACDDDRSLAMSLSISTNRRSVTMLVQGRGREVIAKVEQLSLVGNTIYAQAYTFAKLVSMAEQCGSKTTSIRTEWDKACPPGILSWDNNSWAALHGNNSFLHFRQRYAQQRACSNESLLSCLWGMSFVS